MWTLFWSSIVLACVGTLFLRLAGRKSISQMTIPQVMIMLTLGTVLGTQVSGKGVANTILVLGTFTAFLVAVEWVTLRSNRAERILKGMAIPVIQEGKLIVPNLSKLRLSADDLEKRLRLAGISRIEDVKSGTIETNGELGYELYPHAKPVTRGDLETLMKAYFPQIQLPSSGSESIFSEVQTGSHSHAISDRLQ